jgi:hypothetical protein
MTTQHETVTDNQPFENPKEYYSSSYILRGDTKEDDAHTSDET